MRTPSQKPTARSFFEPINAGKGFYRETWELCDTTGDTIMTLTNVHTTSNCIGRSCIIHAPSKHSMDDWPLNPRGDIIERICPHGIGHPDPDSIAFLDLIHGQGGHGYDVHGCDGCCTRKRFRPIRYTQLNKGAWWPHYPPKVSDDF